ncbi:membrane-spanning 4-domains subfamily A member 4D isoform X2 [Amia ocellicauda]|uniref:membrane-spanning 4-domains subfamily A member 4D isoform X2 n=1 Tax=Amia ocellicauda TaxID=2972642 RepID=UPI0034640080
MSSSVTTADGLVINTNVYPQGQGAFVSNAPQSQSTAAGGSQSQHSRGVKTFLKGEPKAMGAAQIMIGLFSVFTGLIAALSIEYRVVLLTVLCWCAISYLFSGAVCVHAERAPRLSVVKAALALNIFSAVSAVISVIVFCFQFESEYPNCTYGDPIYDYYECRGMQSQRNILNGLVGLMIALSALELCIAVTASAFGCQAIFQDKPLAMVVQQPQAPMTGSSSLDYQPLVDPDDSSVPM